MMNLTDEKIKQIAEELDLGMKVYVHKETLEIKSIIDFDDNLYADPESWQEDIDEIEANYDKYFEFYGMDSRESFRVMADFADTVTDKELKMKLELGLNLSKPFRNFKDIIDAETDYREKWFKFKNQKSIDNVRAQLADRD
ncbi:MAG: hypothetical protein HND52_04785 [Ignavibacteriae bacterium]|nr:hypothetical protein [Ignavibacteriota bacterium]NOG97275.1 hypothetical protein [Ignavibacteriota bacterium]